MRLVFGKTIGRSLRDIWGVFYCPSLDNDYVVNKWSFKLPIQYGIIRLNWERRKTETANCHLNCLLPAKIPENSTTRTRPTWTELSTITHDSVDWFSVGKPKHLRYSFPQFGDARELFRTPEATSRFQVRKKNISKRKCWREGLNRTLQLRSWQEENTLQKPALFSTHRKSLPTLPACLNRFLPKNFTTVSCVKSFWR